MKKEEEGKGKTFWTGSSLYKGPEVIEIKMVFEELKAGGEDRDLGWGWIARRGRLSQTSCGDFGHQSRGMRNTGLFPPPLIHHQPFLWDPRYWVSPEGHSLWVLLTGKFQLDAELFLGLRDAEEGRGGQREAHGSFPV